MSILTDSNGNKSSKRVAGFIVLGMGLIMAAVLFSASIVKKVGDPDTAMSVINTMFITGGSLLGLGIAELFGKKK